MAVLQHMFKQDWLRFCYITGCFFVMAMLCYVTFNEIVKQDVYATTGVNYIKCDKGKCSYVKANVAKNNPRIYAFFTPIMLPVNGVVNFFVNCESGQCSTLQFNDRTQVITPEATSAPAFGYPINLLPGETVQFVVTCDHGPCSMKEIKEGERESTRINRRSLPAANDASIPKYGAVIFKLVCETGGCIISEINGNEKLSLENEEPAFDPIPNSMLGSSSDK